MKKVYYTDMYAEYGKSETLRHITSWNIGNIPDEKNYRIVLTAYICITTKSNLTKSNKKSWLTRDSQEPKIFGWFTLDNIF